MNIISRVLTGILAQNQVPPQTAQKGAAGQIALITIAALAAVTLLLVILRSKRNKSE